MGTERINGWILLISDGHQIWAKILPYDNLLGKIYYLNFRHTFATESDISKNPTNGEIKLGNDEVLSELRASLEATLTSTLKLSQVES